MVTADLNSKVDRIWDAFWTGGMSSPLEIIEQITYLQLQNSLQSRALRGEL